MCLDILSIPRLVEGNTSIGCGDPFRVDAGVALACVLAPSALILLKWSECTIGFTPSWHGLS
jgi:hypothetical protein